MNNSLAEVHPELITEWTEKNLPLTPDDITFGSNKKVWWKEDKGSNVVLTPFFSFNSQQNNAPSFPYVS